MIEIISSNCDPKLKASKISQAALAWSALWERKDLGFFKVPTRDLLWQSSQQRAVEIKQMADQLIVLGIGGSSLGARALQEFLGDQVESHRLEVWDSMDPSYLEYRWSQIKDVKAVHFAIISKSGSTLETLAQAQWVHEKLKSHGLNLAYQSTVITENKKNPLSTWATEMAVPRLEVPEDIGGRFSVLTPVGLLPAAFLNTSLDDLRAGARLACESKGPIEALAAETLASFERQEWITLFWFYSDWTAQLGRWTQQLWAESLAKREARSGAKAPQVSTPMSALGPADQHSLLQQLMEGEKDKWIWVFQFAQEKQKPFDGNLISSGTSLTSLSLTDVLVAEATATARALDESGVSVLNLCFQERSAKSLGYYFMALELLIGTLGEALEINAFNQPGVELGKQIAKGLLKR